MRFSTQETQVFMNAANIGTPEDIAAIVNKYAAEPFCLTRVLDWMQVGLDTAACRPSADPALIARKQAMIDESRVMTASDPANESLQRIAAGGLTATFRAAVGLHGDDPLVLAQLQSGLFKRPAQDPARVECQKMLDTAARRLYSCPH